MGSVLLVVSRLRLHQLRIQAVQTIQKNKLETRIPKPNIYINIYVARSLRDTVKIDPETGTQLRVLRYV